MDAILAVPFALLKYGTIAVYSVWQVSATFHCRSRGRALSLLQILRTGFALWLPCMIIQKSVSSGRSC